MSRGLVIVGAAGRMGRRLVALAEGAGHAVACQVDEVGPALDGSVASVASAVIDFSVPQQTPITAAFCRDFGRPLVLGTTGLDAAQRAAVDAAAQVVPVVAAPNFSVGVTALIELVGQVAAMLADWDAELVEAHHRHKVDAPSGTAQRLAERVAQARGWDLDTVARHGRVGQVGPRADAELGVHVVRGGSVVGDHALTFFSEGESVTLEHRAMDRDIFARGALRAATWALSDGRVPGRYDMADVLRTP